MFYNIDTRWYKKLKRAVARGCGNAVRVGAVSFPAEVSDAMQLRTRTGRNP